MGEMGTYISRRQNIVAQYIATRPIFDMCLEAEKRIGSRVSMRWWEHEGIYFVGLWEAGGGMGIKSGGDTIVGRRRDGCCRLGDTASNLNNKGKSLVIL